MTLWQWFVCVAFTVIGAVVITRWVKREIMERVHDKQCRRIGGDKCGR